MYLSKVQIKNFRNLEDVTVELGEKVVLLGENGTGKSNFLEALRTLLDSNYRPLLGENDFSRDGQKPFGGRKIEIHAWFLGIDPEKDKDLLTVAHDCHGTQENVFQISAVYRPKKDKEENATTEDDYELIRYGGGNENNTKGASSFRQYVRFVLIPAVRDMERDMQSWRTSPLRRLVEMVSLANDQTFKTVADDVKDASTKLQKIPPLQDLQKEIHEVLGSLVESQSIEPTIGIAAASPEDLLRLLTILAEANLPIERSSLGISNVLYLITWLIYVRRLRKIALKGDQKPEYILIAIEEPESHLHPHFQRLIFENVFKQEHLLLVSTHSPTIVSVSDPRHFLVLRRSDNAIKACSTAGFAAGDEKMHKDVSRYLDAARGEMVFARGVLLVEGDAEMFLLPAFAREMKEAGKITHSLDGAGISVCNVYGTDFTPYVKFLKFLDIPFAILTDGDPDNTVTGLKRGLDLAKKLNPPNVAEIESHFANLNWDAVRVGLAQGSIFVNEQTLEVELLNAGYENEFCDVYEELGASEEREESLRQLIQDKDFKTVIKRIENGGGMGKGRFAQRLAGRLDANRVPPYIEKAISYLLEKMSTNTVQPPTLPASDAPTQNFEDEIPF